MLLLLAPHLEASSQLELEKLMSADSKTKTVKKPATPGAQHVAAGPPATTKVQAKPKAAIAQGEVLKNGFTKFEHDAGLNLSREIPGTVAKVFTVGKLLAEVHDSICKRGSTSLYGAWVKEYLPSLERRSVDRWRAAYQAFAPLLEAEASRQACLDRFSITAIYKLSEKRATLANRKAALLLAEQQEITAGLASQLVNGSAKNSATANRLKIDLEGLGTVNVKLEGSDDFAGALSSALKKLCAND